MCVVGNKGQNEQQDWHYFLVFPLVIVSMLLWWSKGGLGRRCALALDRVVVVASLSCCCSLSNRGSHAKSPKQVSICPNYSRASYACICFKSSICNGQAKADLSRDWTGACDFEQKCKEAEGGGQPVCGGECRGRILCEKGKGITD